MKTAKEKLLEYVRKQVINEKDKWLSGMKNNYFEWEDLETKVKEALGL